MTEKQICYYCGKRDEGGEDHYCRGTVMKGGEQEMNICSRCDSQYSDIFIFCPECGRARS